ncbi:biotin-ligase [Flammula alnicola]|nr:biotin-ligase [Flammula alnicola]
MDVLVYSGPEILQTSLNNTLASLRSILVPYYTVQSITQNALTTQPWQGSCALLVLPRCRNRFLSVASKHIKEFVEAGGAYLMLGTDASAIPRSTGLGFGSRGLSLGLEAGETPLKFFDKSNNCYLTCDEEVAEDRVTPRVVALQTPDGTVVNGIYDTEAAQFKGFNDIKGVSVLARYSTDGAEGHIAGLSIPVSKGRIALWAPSIEYPLTEEPVSSAIADSIKLSAEEIKPFDKIRTKLLTTTLLELGLQLPQETEKEQSITRPLPQFLTSTPGKPTIVFQITDAVAAPRAGVQLTSVKDANDEFYFHPLQESSDLLKSTREEAKTSSDPSTWQPKHIIVCQDGALPERELTPLFDLDLFYNALSSARENQGLPTSSEPWGMGEALLYGEAVTSTQTLLDKQLPTPLLSLASHQLAGRGRGSNVWLSPAGCLQFSLLLRVSLDSFPANKLVFIQYLVSLAVVEACRDEAILGAKAGEKVRLKWPNDLYASVGMGKDDLRKIGGVLINTSFSGGKVDIVIGTNIESFRSPAAEIYDNRLWLECP